jgi:secreted trypsin-like serine protease
VIADQPINLMCGFLAAAGTLDPWTQRGRQDLRFTVSGYRLSYSSPVAFVSFRERLMAGSKLVNINSALNDGFNLQTNGSRKDKGGTCSGDSGGPVFTVGY